MNQTLINVAIQLLPSLIEMIRSRTQHLDPAAPAPDDAAVIAALEAAVTSSVTKDDQWLAAHPVSS